MLFQIVSQVLTNAGSRSSIFLTQLLKPCMSDCTEIIYLILSVYAVYYAAHREVMHVALQ